MSGPIPLVLPSNEVETLARGFTWLNPIEPYVEDRRITQLAAHLDLRGLRVLEPGCLEGAVTLGLVGRGARVTSFDIRPQNVVKTFIRGLAFGHSFDVRVGDAETMHEDFPGEWDLVFHEGVFYHLAQPIIHLVNVAPMAKWLFLGTHTAFPGMPLDTSDFWGEPIQFHGYEEGGWDDARSGKDPLSAWLTKDSILRAAARLGLELAATVRDEMHENGPSVGYLFRRP